jgi:peptidoglycan LD-endopeptidase CwlK
MLCSAMCMMRRLLVFWGAIGVSWAMATDVFSADALGSLRNPIIDSAMTEKQAFDGLSPKCPVSVRQRQRLIDVVYYSFDNKVHRGQLVIDKDLVEDIQYVFKAARNARFPIGQVVPVSHPRFRKKGVWSDQLSTAANNTSAFNYRSIEDSTVLSNHAYGRAIDLNPLQNPFVKGKVVLPPGAKFDPRARGTLTENHAVVRAFLQRGWRWGGNWKTPKDYQHFEKP